MFEMFEDFILSLIFGFTIGSPVSLPIIWLGSFSGNPPFWVWAAFALPISLITFISMQK